MPRNIHKVIRGFKTLNTIRKGNKAARFAKKIKNTRSKRLPRALRMKRNNLLIRAKRFNTKR